jgi:lipopolysaccharide transport system permease protein
LVVSRSLVYAEKSDSCLISNRAHEGEALGSRTSADWTVVISPRRPWLDLRLGELWHARELIALFVRRDFVAGYTQTILGPLWFLLQPLVTTLTFTVIFGRIARLPSDGVPSFLFYMAGMVVWTYFAACLTKTADTFTTNANLFGKVYLPRLSVPISIVISNLITFAIQLALFLVFLLVFWLRGVAVRPGPAILLLPLLVLLMAGLGFGLGTIVSSLTTRYRDLHHVVGFGTHLLLYATPLVYPLSLVPDGWRAWIEANPLAPIVEAFRYAFLGAGTISVGSLAYSAAFACAVVVVALVLFNRVEQTFVDTI